MIRAIFFLFSTAVAFGSPYRGERIVGGQSAVDGQFPYQVSLRNFPTWAHLCGGSVISESWILSAAFCTFDRDPSSVRIIAGTVLLNGGADPIIREVSRIVNHPDYDRPTLTQNICVIRVSIPYVWSANVQPIRIGNEFIGGGVTVVLSGWGATSPIGGPFSNNLNWLPKQTLTNSDCRARLDTLAPLVIDSKICTQTRPGQGICEGDHGGPVTAAGAIIGIINWSVSCAREFPDVHERVAYWYSWINSNAVG